MSPFKTPKAVDTTDLTNDSAAKLNYDVKTKACIPLYNIKVGYNPEIKPFFSPRDLPEVELKPDGGSEDDKSVEGL